jgi:hypothetical protein
MAKLGPALRRGAFFVAIARPALTNWALSLDKPAYPWDRAIAPLLPRCPQPVIALKTLVLLDAVREELLAHLALVGLFRHRSISHGENRSGGV